MQYCPLQVYLHLGVLEVGHEGALKLPHFLPDVVHEDALDELVLAQVQRTLDSGQCAVHSHVRRCVADLRLQVAFDLQRQLTRLLQQLLLLDKVKVTTCQGHGTKVNVTKLSNCYYQGHTSS